MEAAKTVLMTVDQAEQSFIHAHCLLAIHKVGQYTNFMEECEKTQYSIGVAKLNNDDIMVYRRGEDNQIIFLGYISPKSILNDVDLDLKLKVALRKQLVSDFLDDFKMVWSDDDFDDLEVMDYIKQIIRTQSPNGVH